ncbi:MAG: aromatic ring-hydroxylating dioxygenase subunit alpha [Acidimicrobiales bacterium]
MAVQTTPSIAPLDPGELERSLAAFGHSRMLPVAAYIDPDVFDWEKRNFLERGWMCIGFSADIAQPGDQRAESTGIGGVLLIRAQDGVLRAFANVCSHRGHELLPCGETAHHGRVICPYHSWAYDLEGKLATAPSFSGVEGFVKSEHGLNQLPCVEWHGLIFLDASGEAPPLAEQLADLSEIVAPYEPERLIIADRHDYVVAANWKTLTENYHECYHCTKIHPQLCEVSDPESGMIYSTDGPWAGGTMDIKEGMETMSMDGRSSGVMLRGLSEEQRRIVIYINVFPDVLISLHPDYVMMHRLTPLAADATRIECIWAFAPESFEKKGFDPSYGVNFWDLTNQQDWEACSSVHRGLSSPHAVPGMLSTEEEAVYDFVTMVARGYKGEPVRNVKVPARLS